MPEHPEHRVLRITRRHKGGDGRTLLLNDGSSLGRITNVGVLSPARSPNEANFSEVCSDVQRADACLPAAVNRSRSAGQEAIGAAAYSRAL